MTAGKSTAYFDTSCLAKCYLDEAGTESSIRAAVEFDRIQCSETGQVEMVSAFRRAWRKRRLSATSYAAALDQLVRDNADGLVEWMPLTPAVLTTAVEVLGAMPGSAAIGAADAIHLATAKVAGFREIWSADRQMLAAAKYFGLRPRNPAA